MIEIASVKVSVIICAYSLDRFTDILEAVSSALTQKPGPHEVIVAVDYHRELFEQLTHALPKEAFLVVNEGEKGLSDTRNTGIRAATGNIIAFIDDDAAAQTNWLQNILQPFADPNTVAVGGRITPKWLEGTRPSWFPEELDWTVGCTYVGLPQNRSKVRNLIGCNMAFRAELFRSIGLFDNKFGRTSKNKGIGEDSEFCLRINRNIPNAQIVFEPTAVVVHKVPAWRATPTYIFRRSLDEGFHKSKLKRFFHHKNSDTLSKENTYLRFLIFTAIPRRLKTVYRFSSFQQLSAIIMCIIATGIGYTKGFFSPRNPR